VAALPPLEGVELIFVVLRVCLLVLVGSVGSVCVFLVLGFSDFRSISISKQDIFMDEAHHLRNLVSYVGKKLKINPGFATVRFSRVRADMTSVSR
jgi:hypothetical protein